MSGPNRAEARSATGQERDLGQDGQADQGLAQSRGRLTALAARLEEPDQNAEPDEQYWFYEYLRQLSLEVNDLLEEFDGHLQPPIGSYDVVVQLIQPLEEIYDDLCKYFWKPRCLLSRLAVSEVDKALLKTTGEIRRAWSLLASAIREYVTARPDLAPDEPVDPLAIGDQTPERPMTPLAASDQTPERPKTLLATSEAFSLRLLEFVTLMSGLVDSKGFTREHSRLANSLGLAPRANRGQVGETTSISARPSLARWYEDRSLLGETEQEMRSAEDIKSPTIESLPPILYASDSEHSTLTFDYTPGQVVRVDANGSFYQSVHGKENLDIDSSAYGRSADEAFAFDWRFKSKQQGKDLFGKLFSEPRVVSIYNRALGAALEKPENLHLRFQSPRDILRLPLEFLHDAQDYLVLQYPLFRALAGPDVPVSNRRPLDAAFLNDLHRQGKPLSVLLIASDTPPELPHVDEEVDQIAKRLQDMADKKGLRLDPTTLSSDDATVDEVKKAISTGDYHIIHYAGHAVASKRPEESYIRFWTRTKKTGDVEDVKMPMLRGWFGGAKSVRFVFLSCCAGAAQDTTEQLLTNDVLGIADTLIQASVPAVLGHRWPIEDSSVKDLSISFYHHLLKYGRIDTALLHARREMAYDRDERAWLSPVLILQC